MVSHGTLRKIITLGHKFAISDRLQEAALGWYTLLDPWVRPYRHRQYPTDSMESEDLGLSRWVGDEAGVWRGLLYFAHRSQLAVQTTRDKPQELMYKTVHGELRLANELEHLPMIYLGKSK